MSIRIVQGDCRDVMQTFDAESVDAIVTDPPYMLNFMGKSWDTPSMAGHVVRFEGRDRQSGGLHRGPGTNSRGYADNKEPILQQYWHEAWAREAYRVLKPGGHLLAFGGTRTFHRLAVAIEDAGFEIRDCLMWLYGSGFPKSHNLHDEWDGWGTALKPSFEPIILARKPLIGTVAANVTRYGTGAINVDACRIGTTRDTPASLSKNKNPNGDYGPRSVGIESDLNPNVGRWPANVILDEEAAALLDAQSGERPVSGSARNGKPATGTYPPGMFGMGKGQGTLHNDTGGASRFFYTAKASRSERNKGLEGVVEVPADAYGEFADDGRGRQTEHTPRANHHPTVKPLDLMQWLCRLVTPPGGTVLDPFMGSGSTLIAADREGFNGIGIELDAEYVEIARRRIYGDAPLFAEVNVE